MGDTELELFDKIKHEFNLGEVDMRTYSPLTLAFIGDAVFDIVIRSIIVGKINKSTDKMHREKSRIVRASAQAAMIDAIGDILTEEEADIYRRGRNAHTHTKAKSATVADYRKATGLEALSGYLYLQGRTDRLLELIKIGLDRVDLDI